MGLPCNNPGKTPTRTSCPLCRLQARSFILQLQTVPAAGLAMGPRPSSLLVLVLCLGLAIHTQGGVLPKPSIWAEPGPVICWGQSVTIVCWGPAGANAFRLEGENGSVHGDQTVTPPHGSNGTKATFPIHAVSEHTPRRYRCLYRKGSDWSNRSETLELKVTGAPTVVCSTPVTRTKPPSTAGPTHGIPILTESATSRAALEGTGLSPKYLYILVGVCVASVLCLLLLVLLLVHRQHQKKRGPPSGNGEEPRPQDRLSPTADLTESPADVATTVDPLPEEKGDMHSPSPAAEDPQEVTYAQLDQRALTRRAAPAASPPPAEPTPESSTYAALPRH